MINCRAATRSYASHPVLRGIDLIVEPGAGKSTLLRLLSGLEEPDSGSVSIGGPGFRDHGIEIRRNLGVLPEGLGLFESLTIIENLMAIGPASPSDVPPVSNRTGIGSEAWEANAEFFGFLFGAPDGFGLSKRKPRSK